jgi:ribosomal protein S18 acetylase RimI-like enzyme
VSPNQRRRANSLQVRTMQSADLPAAMAASAAAFGLDITDGAEELRWRQRMAYGLSSDPEGSFVAERDGRVIGVAQALRRERLWCLSTLAVQPGIQSTGAGRALLERALAYDAGTDAGLIVSSSDPRALRLYGLAGFSLRPAFEAGGTVDRRAQPRPEPGIREADGRDVEAVAGISREIRGAPHTAELVFQLGRGFRMLRFGDRGFALAQEGHGVWMVVARDDEAAQALLWSGLELAGEAERPLVRWITGGQDWAIDVLLRAGLRLVPAGALAVRGCPGPLRPFIPSPPFA